jgi:thymidylate synthase ThyX
MYLKGSVRSFIHYIGVRDDEGVAQWEHVELARSVRTIFSTQFPTIYRSLFDEKTQKPLYTEDEKDREILKLKTTIELLRAQSPAT